MSVVPAYIFDEHNEAFYFWNKARHDGYFSKPLDLFHIDAHADMGGPERFDSALFFSGTMQDGYLKYYKRFAKNELNIGNFIVPAVLSGLIRNVYFIYPEWRKFSPKRTKYNVCSAFGEGKILKHNLKIDVNTDRKVFLGYPDLTIYNFAMHEADRMPMNRKVLLDIDLDYFACRDTILNHMRYELEITKKQFIRKEVFASENKTLPFSGLEFDFQQKDGRYYATIRHKKQKEMAYLPTRERVQSDITTLVETLRKKRIKPAAITICRSSISGYCPADYNKFIETYLRQKLEDIYDIKLLHEPCH